MTKTHSWEIIHSSKRMNWRTPPALFEALDEIFRFDLDLATDGLSNALCTRYYTPEDDALTQTWDAGNHRWSWCNPPYGRGIHRWFDKAVDEAGKGARIVMLANGCTDTRWFRQAWTHCREIWLFTGRIKFVDPDDQSKPSAPAPKGSALYVFDGQGLGPPIIRLCTLGGSGWPSRGEIEGRGQRYRVALSSQPSTCSE